MSEEEMIIQQLFDDEIGLTDKQKRSLSQPLNHFPKKVTLLPRLVKLLKRQESQKGQFLDTTARKKSC